MNRKPLSRTESALQWYEPPRPPITQVRFPSIPPPPNSIPVAYYVGYGREGTPAPTNQARSAVPPRTTPSPAPSDSTRFSPTPTLVSSEDTRFRSLSPAPSEDIRFLSPPPAPNTQTRFQVAPRPSPALSSAEDDEMERFWNPPRAPSTRARSRVPPRPAPSPALNSVEEDEMERFWNPPPPSPPRAPTPYCTSCDANSPCRRTRHTQSSYR